jgi:hypothetical protein
VQDGYVAGADEVAQPARRELELLGDLGEGQVPLTHRATIPEAAGSPAGQ